MEKPSGLGSSPKACSPMTTFVQTEAAAFKELVQRLTGPKAANDQSPVHASSSTSPATPRSTGVRRPTFKLQERRQGSRSKLTIIRPNSPVFPLVGFSPHSPLGLGSPASTKNYLFSPLIAPSTYLSGPRVNDEKRPKTPSLGLDEEAEEKAIEARRFYVHPTPSGSRPRNNEPVLLPLFPLTSPTPKPAGP